MKRSKRFRQIAVAILIATLLCDKGIIYINAAGLGSMVPAGSVSSNDVQNEYGPENGRKTEGTDLTADAGGGETTDGLEEGVDYAPGEVILVLEDGGYAALALEGIDEEVSGDDETQFVVVDLEEDVSVEEAVDYYSGLPGIAYAQPNYIYEFEDDKLWEEAVNDPRYTEQWYLDYLNMEEAWRLMDSVPCSPVKVAVIDSGIDLYHGDLNANVDPASCVNSVTTAYPKIDNDYSANGHGTHIAGIVGAVTGNGQGVAGVAGNYAKISAIQCHDGNKMLSSYVVNAIQYAVMTDADIINLSMGTSQSDPLLENAMQKAYDAGILIVCSAGNDGTDRTHYPSAYSSGIGVIATGKNGQKRSDANYGTDNFISAPGDQILNTLPNGRYGYLGGSSMSAGVVSGVAAAMLSVNPSLSVEEVKQILAETAVDTYSPGFDAYSGWGIVSADKAVKTAIEMRYGQVPPEPEEPEEPEIQDKLPDSPESFVRRLYRYCLGREADEDGLMDWTNRLSSGRENGGEVAAGFLFSPEFKAFNLNNEQYVEVLYRLFLARKPDEGGKADWVAKLNNGMSREYVMNGFSASPEFQMICEGCGIHPGTVPLTQMRDQNEQATAFIVRMYEKALGRSFDEEGLNDWCQRLLGGSWTPYRIATEGFFHSPEFLMKNTTDEEFVKILYRTFLNREYDEAGLAYWLNRLSRGESRDRVIAGFSDSREFADFMAKYGLER